MNREPIVKTSGPGETVPLEWPAMRTDAPLPVRSIRGLLALPAMLLLWFAPKRMGPFVAAAGWHAAVWASLIGIGIGLGLPACRIRIGWTETGAGPSYLTFHLGARIEEYTVGEMPRAPLAALVSLIHAEMSNPDWSAASGYTILLILAVILAAILASLLTLAAILMPFAAAGERLVLLFGRCLRLVLWSMTILIPIGVAVLFWPWVLDHLAGAVPSPSDQRLLHEIMNAGSNVPVLGLVAVGIWWLAVLWRSGLRYAGPADGPAWRPRTPRCAKCGYIIAMLQVASRCPECNHSVADSVTRRQRRIKSNRRRFFVASLRDALRSAKEG